MCKLSTDANGVRTVYSQFALKQFAQGKRTLKCAAATPWTWCLNKPCTVDPANPTKAICACDVLRTLTSAQFRSDLQADTLANGSRAWLG